MSKSIRSIQGRESLRFDHGITLQVPLLWQMHYLTRLLNIVTDPLPVFFWGHDLSPLKYMERRAGIEPAS